MHHREVLVSMRKTRAKSVRVAKRQARTVASPTLKYPPNDLASLIRGLYGRVARKLGVDPSYVSRVARSERSSEVVEAELIRQLEAIMKSFKTRRKGSRKTPAH